MRVLALIAILATSLAGMPSANAHSPYYSDTRKLSASGSEPVSLKLLNGDGIFFADPARAIIVNPDGVLLAVSPRSVALSLYCKGSGSSRVCFAYEELTRTIYEPDVGQWEDAGKIEKEGRPLAYPENMDAEFGFVQRPATLAETATIELENALHSWVGTAIAIAWWTLFWALVLPIVRPLFGYRKRPSVVAIVFRLVAAVGMVPLTLYGWLLAPYSAYYFALVFLAGALIAFSATSVPRESAV